MLQIIIDIVASYYCLASVEEGSSGRLVKVVKCVTVIDTTSGCLLRVWESLLLPQVFVWDRIWPFNPDWPKISSVVQADHKSVTPHLRLLTAGFTPGLLLQCLANETMLEKGLHFLICTKVPYGLGKTHQHSVPRPVGFPHLPQSSPTNVYKILEWFCNHFTSSSSLPPSLQAHSSQSSGNSGPSFLLTCPSAYSILHSDILTQKLLLSLMVNTCSPSSQETEAGKIRSSRSSLAT